jgi:heme exporter protein A
MTLVARNLSCFRGSQQLFRNLNVSLTQGELLLIQGQNGTGKSTLLQIMAGLLSPLKGQILWDEKIIAKNSHYYDCMSYLGHKDALKKDLTLDENIAMHLALAQVSTTSQKQDEILSALALSHQRTMLSQSLSAGQRRKTALATLMLKARKLWIMDEPFTALDTNSIKVVEDLLNTHLSQGGMIVMASHHNNSFTAATTTKVIHCHDQRI